MNLPDADAMMSMDTPLETVFDALDDGILVVDEHLQPIWLNRACGRLLGFDSTTVQGASTVPPALQDFLRRLGLEPGASHSEGRRAAQRLQVESSASPAPIPVEVALTFGHLGTRRIVTASIRDISSQQQMERAVYDARKTQAIGSLASGIAHDFNNILTAIISQIDLVLYGGELPSGLRHHLIYAQTSARRGAELVSKLQAFSRQSAPKFEVVDLAELVDQAMFMLRRGITPLIQIRPPETNRRAYPVRADTNQILQVILNLGINARDAMPKGGAITLSIDAQTIDGDAPAPPRRPGHFIRLQIADNGHGMSPDTAARIFEPYFTTKDLSRGPGLGLSIAASVMAEHAGWIEVTSSEGEGSCFSIYFPSCVSPEIQKPAPAIEKGPAAQGRERILVVDDEELVRMVTKAVLAYRGYQIFEAIDGEDAVRIYAETDPRFDLVLMDLHMPRLNGYDALLRIRQINPGLKAVLISGGSQDPASLGGEIEGVAYLQKPFDNQELAVVVRRLLDTR